VAVEPKGWNFAGAGPMMAESKGLNFGGAGPVAEEHKPSNFVPASLMMVEPKGRNFTGSSGPLLQPTVDCENPPKKRIRVKRRPTQLPKELQKFGYCNNFNNYGREVCRRNAKCPYKHRCTKCDGNHPVTQHDVVVT